MLIFHEGLPRSGKSYAAMVDHIIKRLKDGRKVFAYIEGLNHDKIAEVSEIDPSLVRERLIQITREQVQDIYKYVEKDSLVVIDEAANFWPSGRQKLSPEMVIFIKEHGHEGLDILLMDQVLEDVHSTWKGRIDTKVTFRKLDSIGKEDQYEWVVYKNVNKKFIETTRGKSEYDPKYFGTYKSHSDGTSNTGNYQDSRANVFNSKAWKILKLYGVIALIAVGFIVWFFSGGGAKSMTKEPPRATTGASVDPNAVAAAENAKVAAGQQAAKLPAPKKEEAQPMWSGTPTDYIDELAKNARPRLGGTLRIGRKVAAYIEWRDNSNRLIERLTIQEVQGLGWFVMISADGGIATISKPGKMYVATQWPTQDDRQQMPAQVPDEQQKAIQGQQPTKVAQITAPAR